jgi:hypothetical protein
MTFGGVHADFKMSHNPSVRADRWRLNMNRLLLGFALFALCLSTMTSDGQHAKLAVDESSAVRATVTNYIEAYYLGDAGRMQQTLHPHYLKHVIHGNIAMREMTGPDMVSAVRNGPPDIPHSERTEQVSVLDVSGNIASAKLVTPGWVDYMTLSKETQGWRIVSVVQKIEN